MFVTAATTFAADHGWRLFEKAADIAIDIDLQLHSWVLHVLTDFVQYGSLCVAVGPVRINITWPVAD